MCLCTLSVSAQEDIKLSTSTWQHVVYAPSLSMVHSDLNITALFRTQWNISGSPVAGLLSSSSQISSSNTFVSGYLGFERISIYDKSLAEIGVTQRIKLNTNNYIGLGISSGVNSINVDLARAQFTQGDQVISNLLVSQNRLLLTSSATYSNLKYKMNLTLGFKDVLNFKNLVGHITKNVELGNKFELDASTFVKHSLSTKRTEVDVTVMGTFNNFISLGSTWRNTKQVVGLVDFNLKDKVKIGYAYDFHYGNLSGLNAHEIVLKFKIQGSNVMRKIGFTNPRI